MTTSVRLCLSYGPLKSGFIASKMDNISGGKCIADKDVVNDITSTHQSVITRDHTTFMTQRYPLNNGDII